MESKGSTGRQERAEPRDGTIIAGRYQVDRLIARGGMAAVYLAHHVKLNRPVALKILSPPPDAEDPGAFEERFQLEAETLASLDHPNIVILHDFGETADGRFFLAMEFVEGPRLSDALRDGPLPSERALHLIMQVCAALRYAHKRGVVHRDLKPSNLLIRRREDGEEKVKVVDFGLVKLTEADQSITRAGLILGSPHCMAPEQVKGLDVDHRADIYATGVLMFRALTGQYPFHGPNSAATMIAHLNQPVPTFFSVAPELVAPAGLEEIEVPVQEPE
ncbi:MAG: serine/threonine protein kinase [Deltaproteobacteria bacterium]|nr:serine/threonine protein kinase [Deltaproteobacteria bacterium]